MSVDFRVMIYAKHGEVLPLVRFAAQFGIEPGTEAWRVLIGTSAFVEIYKRRPRPWVSTVWA